ncbi:MAG: hypothetical protein KDA80_04105, partial [Planctomycetaceae bacterium]|nr:hypothetical protein [Planctomycetaceae bacterium]
PRPEIVVHARSTVHPGSSGGENSKMHAMDLLVRFIRIDDRATFREHTLARGDRGRPGIPVSTGRDEPDQNDKESPAACDFRYTNCSSIG